MAASLEKGLFQNSIQRMFSGPYVGEELFSGEFILHFKIDWSCQNRQHEKLQYANRMTANPQIP